MDNEMMVMYAPVNLGVLVKIGVPDDLASVIAFREACNQLKLGVTKIGGGPGFDNFSVRYKDPADLIRLGCMYQSLKNQN